MKATDTANQARERSPSYPHVHMYGLVPGRFFKGGDFCLRVEIKIQVVTSFAVRGFFYFNRPPCANFKVGARGSRVQYA